MRGVGWIATDHTVTNSAGYWEMFDDGCWQKSDAVWS